MDQSLASLGPTPSWHILRVSPGREERVQVSINFLPTFVPRRTVSRFSRRRRVWLAPRLEVIWPGYVFTETYDPHFLLHFPCDDLLGIIRTANRNFAVLSTAQMQEIRAIEKVVRSSPTRVPSSFAPRPHGLAVGDRVRRKTDETNFLRTIVTAVWVEKIEVEIQLLGRTHRAIVEASQFEKIEAGRVAA